MGGEWKIDRIGNVIAPSEPRDLTRDPSDGKTIVHNSNFVSSVLILVIQRSVTLEPFKKTLRQTKMGDKSTPMPMTLKI